MKLLDRYLARQVIANTLLVLLVLTAISSLIMFVGEFDQVGQAHYTLGAAARYTVLYVPAQAYAMFPVAVLLGTMLGLGDLAAHHELMVLRTAGVSVLRIGLGAMLGGALLVMVCVLLGEFLAPPAERSAEDQRSLLLYNQANVLGAGGIWAKDGSLFVNVKKIGQRDTAQNIYLFDFDAAHHLLSAARAGSAVFSDGNWTLRDLRETRLTAQGAVTHDVHSSTWQTSLAPGLLNLFVVNTNSLSARGLYHYIDYLQANGIDAGRYIAAFWGKLAQPISVLVMMLLALPFVFGPMRSSSVGQRLLVGMLIGIGFYVFNSIFTQTGVVFGLNPAFTAWFPTALLAIISGIAVSRIR
ncbi:MAG TPA: LPS export ABC transporter permease LptG [Gammaproteobacteria bacterium]|nr:LPS export ABC transporter permease LptG [Gammaproteobacteria bacterium]